jgi:predicted Fe-Mo cluster-binding NifX family protein
MKSISSLSKPVVVAVPVYETRVLPRFGVAREFVVAEVAPLAGVAHRVERRTWEPPKAPSLARWLADLGVTGVICGGIHPRFVVELEAEGLWVLWGQHGETQEVISRWSQGEVVACGEPECADKPRTGCTGSEPLRQRRRKSKRGGTT